MILGPTLTGIRFTSGEIILRLMKNNLWALPKV